MRITPRQSTAVDVHTLSPLLQLLRLLLAAGRPNLLDLCQTTPR